MDWLAGSASPSSAGWSSSSKAIKKRGGCNNSSRDNSNNHNFKKGNVSKGGVKLSTDPQSVAARERRHRISDRFKILQSMVPGGTKMDTVSMLEEAIHYVKFLKTQIWLHQAIILNNMNNFPDHHHHNNIINTNRDEENYPSIYVNDPDDYQNNYNNYDFPSNDDYNSHRQQNIEPLIFPQDTLMGHEDIHNSVECFPPLQLPHYNINSPADYNDHCHSCCFQGDHQELNHHI